MMVARQTKQEIIDELTEMNIKQQGYIKRLENRIKRHDSNYQKALKQIVELKEKIQELKNGLSKDIGDIIATKEKEYVEIIDAMAIDLSRYEDKVINLEKDNQKLKNELNRKNVRGAGRKNKFDEETKEKIRLYKIQGKTIKELANEFKCSYGLIGNIVKGL